MNQKDYGFWNYAFSSPQKDSQGPYKAHTRPTNGPYEAQTKFLMEVIERKGFSGESRGVVPI
jgi:hypothetical protein